MKTKTESLLHLNESFNACNKCTSAICDKKIFGCGNPDSDICVIGEYPQEEDINKSVPFSGKIGVTLEKIFKSVGIEMNSLYITNALLCRTDLSNRIPYSSEVNNCRNRLCEELKIIQPKITILVGSTALKSIFGNNKHISDEHGEWHTTMSQPCYFYFPIYNPMWMFHAITSGEERRKKLVMWDDIKKFRDDKDTLIKWQQ